MTATYSRVESIRAKIMRGQNGFTYWLDADDQAGSAEDVEYLLGVADAASEMLDCIERLQVPLPPMYIARLRMALQDVYVTPPGRQPQAGDET